MWASASWGRVGLPASQSAGRSVDVARCAKVAATLPLGHPEVAAETETVDLVLALNLDWLKREREREGENLYQEDANVT